MNRRNFLASTLAPLAGLCSHDAAWLNLHRFFSRTLAELARAIQDGAKVRAFHAWNLMDNFEWTDGNSQGYGLTYVEFRDVKRTVKDSGLWYRRAAASNQLTN